MSDWAVTGWAIGRKPRVGFVLAAALALTACDSAKMPNFLKPKDRAAEAGEDGAAAAVQTSERDVEAPDVFEVTEDGLWDGRPSLGGVWAAHPTVKDPERIIIRNEVNGQFVIGALFRKELETPGPKLQISSDAAAALGMLAGQPTKLHVVALRREEAPVDLPEPEAAAADLPAEGALDAPSTIESQPLDPVAAAAEAALAPVEPAPQPVAAPPPAPAPKPAPKPTVSKLKKPYLQIGIFSVEKNAQNTATSMRQRGLIPTVKKQSSAGKTFWRVIVGPAQNKAELDILIDKVKSAGFTDAYAVTN